LENYAQKLVNYIYKVIQDSTDFRKNKIQENLFSKFMMMQKKLMELVIKIQNQTNV